MPDKPTISDRMDEKFKDENQTYLSKYSVPQNTMKIDDYFEDVSNEFQFKTERKATAQEMKTHNSEKTLKPNA